LFSGVEGTYGRAAGVGKIRAERILQKNALSLLTAPAECEMAIKAVLLDVDGTLIDSVSEHAMAWVDVCEEYGYQTDYDKVRRMIGMGGDRVLPELTGLEEDSEIGKQMVNRRGEIFREEYLPTLKPFARVRELLERFVSDGYKLVAASSASVEDLKLLLEKAGVEDLFHDQTSSDDAENSKPAPDIIEAALERAQWSASEAIMIGDTPYDVKAANKAGVACIAFRCGGWEDDELRDAIEIYDDAEEMLDDYDGSVLADAGVNAP
jgi:HAD superfamily hydrolase (TIGR01509 family)